jgi:hypothetical protein
VPLQCVHVRLAVATDKNVHAHSNAGLLKPWVQNADTIRRSGRRSRSSRSLRRRCGWPGRAHHGVDAGPRRQPQFSKFSVFSEQLGRVNKPRPVDLPDVHCSSPGASPKSEVGRLQRGRPHCVDTLNQITFASLKSSSADVAVVARGKAPTRGAAEARSEDKHRCQRSRAPSGIKPGMLPEPCEDQVNTAAPAEIAEKFAVTSEI